MGVASEPKSAAEDAEERSSRDEEEEEDGRAWIELTLEEETKEERESENMPRADPVFIHLVPLGALGEVAEADSSLVVQSGFAATEDATVHRLSRIVLQLAVLNFLLALCLELYRLVLNLMKGSYVSIVFFFFWVGFAYYVCWLGVQGVRTRNASCCECCNDCGFLQAFQFIYVVFAVLRAVRLLVALIYLDAREIVFNFLLLLITASTAEYSRQLILVIQGLPPVIRARVPETTDATPVPLAAAEPIP